MILNLFSYRNFATIDSPKSISTGSVKEEPPIRKYNEHIAPVATANMNVSPSTVTRYSLKSSSALQSEALKKKKKRNFDFSVNEEQAGGKER